MEQYGRAIFVDDDSSVLRSLRRGLRMHYKHWEMEFEQSPEVALSRLKNFDAWVVISDKKMRELDGADFLDQVAEQTPQAIRVLLTGDISDETAVASAKSAHLLLPKPFELDDLIDVLERSVYLRTLPISASLRQTLGGLQSLPVLPKAYQDLSAYLKTTQMPENKKVAEIVTQDIGILSKVLQLANSSFFGATTPVNNVEMAIVRLGHDLIKQIVLCAGLFSQPVTLSDDLEETGEEILQQSEEIAGVMKELAICAGLSRKAVDNIYVLGLLHQIGWLVDGVKQEGDKCATGAYLLQLWGFDNAFCEAVLYQNDPQKQPELTILTNLLFLGRQVVLAQKEGVPFFEQSEMRDLIDKANVGAYFRE